MATAIDLRGLVRPQLVEATKREDNPNVAEFRLQPLERGQQRFGLSALPVQLPYRPWPIAIVTLKHRTLSPVVALFLDRLRTHVKATASTRSSTRAQSAN